MSLALGPVARAVAAQTPTLRIQTAEDQRSPVRLVMDRGFAAVPMQVVSDLGWATSVQGGRISLSVPGQISLELSVGSPYFTWDGVSLQLADAPYRDGGQVYVPVQLLTDFLPRRLPDLYDFDGARSILRAGDPALIGGGPQAGSGTDAAGAPTQPEPYDGVRVVVIDAGHGGADPGAIAPSGVREKDVALGIALALRDALEEEEDVEVYMVRDDDTFVDVWMRGELATEWKGERPGIFVSVHGNSFPNQRATRGFETYFLSEARTEHERRVAAIENAPVRVPEQASSGDVPPDLDFILRELRNLDHQHWSALLAEMVQQELDGFHPGPDRGVKQGVLAVLTNALMPAVLVEVGYLSNDAEGRLLGQADFQRSSGDAIARAVMSFFERYPPGNGAGGPEGAR